MDGCVYRTKDGECDLYSEGGKFHAFCCNMNSCEGRKMSNYDRIISKSPEELAEWIAGGILNLTGGSLKMATEAWLDWLREEAKEGE